ncbi:MAG: hypothetical protein Kow0037_30250 [Calditrichia bacterium]
MNWKNGNRPLVYLAGAIEKAPDSGRKWRADLSEFITRNLNHDVFNPTLEESHLLTPEEFRHFREWKTSDLPRFRRVMHKIISTDLGKILTGTDYIICYYDEYVLSGGGTQGELTMAYWHRIPVYMVTPIPLSELSSWILGCTSEVFSDFDSLKQFLLEKFKGDGRP